jgi:hypothetical protein
LPKHCIANNSRHIYHAVATGQVSWVHYLEVEVIIFELPKALNSLICKPDQFLDGHIRANVNWYKLHDDWILLISTDTNDIISRPFDSRLETFAKVLIHDFQCHISDLATLQR